MFASCPSFSLMTCNSLDYEDEEDEMKLVGAKGGPNHAGAKQLATLYTNGETFLESDWIFTLFFSESIMGV